MTERSPFGEMADFIGKAVDKLPEDAKDGKIKIIEGRKGPWLSLQTHNRIWRWQNNRWVEL